MSTNKLFSKILIANRGEIACRIIQTAKKMGILCVAVYSEVDSQSLHVQLADEAYLIGEAPSQSSYLNAEKIIKVALDTECDAIHPGYGFLSENAGFAKRCEKENIIFIGPKADAIDAMGSKSNAKKIMEKAKVPVVPGYHGAKQDPKILLKEANKIGYPILIKATAGGGGKGMRVVEKKEDFSTDLDAVKREALKSFANDEVILEKYLIKPEHIEVQIFGDEHGNVVHLFERDCSIQRRQQKIIEQAPASHLSSSLRKKLCDTAIQAAKAINYCGAGTIEFLVSGEEFYFLEMNTRLQVEHPITEMITGIDLVAWQLLIASGAPLPLQQKEITCKGYAIEARLYAENPQQNFLPATGTIDYLHTPTLTEYCRFDSGIQAGDKIGIHYDPMLAKLICWSEDRTHACQLLETALAECQIAGLTTNINYLRLLMRHKDFIAGKTHTLFVDQKQDELQLPTQPPHEIIAYASLYLLLSETSQTNNPWQNKDAWQMNLESVFRFQLTHDSENFDILLTHDDNGYCININNSTILVEKAELKQNHLSITQNNHQLSVTVFEKENEITLFTTPFNWKLKRFNSLSYYDNQQSTDAPLTAPMPGTVIAVMAKAGETVTQGQALLIIEAMKMEHTIHAPHEGTIKKIRYNINDQVNEGAELVSFEAA